MSTPKPNLVQTVISILKTTGGGLNPYQIANLAGRNVGAFSKTFPQLVRNGTIYCTGTTSVGNRDVPVYALTGANPEGANPPKVKEEAQLSHEHKRLLAELDSLVTNSYVHLCSNETAVPSPNRPKRVTDWRGCSSYQRCLQYGWVV